MLARFYVYTKRRVKGAAAAGEGIGASFKKFVLKVLTCDIGGQWSGRTPQCRYVDCGAPAQISHGMVKLVNGTTTVGSRIEYTCDEDFEISGDANQECTIDGKWSFREKPQCYSNCRVYYFYCIVDS